jgi:hypothetical protein
MIGHQRSVYILSLLVYSVNGDVRRNLGNLSKNMTFALLDRYLMHMSWALLLKKTKTNQGKCIDVNEIFDSKLCNKREYIYIY